MIGLEETTPTVVETNILKWIQNGLYKVKKEASDPMWHFKFSAEAQRDRALTIGQLKGEDSSRFITVAANFDLDNELKEKIANLSPSKREQLRSELRLELIRLRIGYSLTPLLQNMRIDARLPIIGLTEWDFLERVRIMDGGAIVVTEKIKGFLAAQN